MAASRSIAASAAAAARAEVDGVEDAALGITSARTFPPLCSPLPSLPDGEQDHHSEGLKQGFNLSESR